MEFVIGFIGGVVFGYWFKARVANKAISALQSKVDKFSHKYKD